VPVQELLEVVPAPLPVDLAEQALRHARRLHYAEALQHGGLVRHQFPQQELALRDVAQPHAAAHLGHVAHHYWGEGFKIVFTARFKYAYLKIQAPGIELRLCPVWGGRKSKKPP